MDSLNLNSLAKFSIGDPLPAVKGRELAGVFMSYHTLPGNVENLDGFERYDTLVLNPRSWGNEKYPKYRNICVALGREAILALKAWHVLG